MYNTGGSIHAFFNCKIVLFYSFPYLNSLSLVVSLVRGRAFFKNPLINHLLKFRNPKNTYTSLTIISVGYSCIFLILFWLI